VGVGGGCFACGDTVEDSQLTARPRGHCVPKRIAIGRRLRRHHRHPEKATTTWDFHAGFHSYHSLRFRKQFPTETLATVFHPGSFGSPRNFQGLPKTSEVLLRRPSLSPTSAVRTTDAKSKLLTENSRGFRSPKAMSRSNRGIGPVMLRCPWRELSSWGSTHKP